MKFEMKTFSYTKMTEINFNASQKGRIKIF